MSELDWLKDEVEQNAGKESEEDAAQVARGVIVMVGLATAQHGVVVSPELLRQCDDLRLARIADVVGKVEDSGGVGPDAGHERGSGRGADCDLAEGAGEDEGLRGEPVEVRGDHVVLSVGHLHHWAEVVHDLQPAGRGSVSKGELRQ